LAVLVKHIVNINIIKVQMKGKTLFELDERESKENEKYKKKV